GEQGTFHVPAVLNANGYAWTLPAGWSASGSTTNDSITVTVGSTGGNISVYAQNSCGNTADISKAIVIRTPVAAVITVSDDSVMTASGFLSYQWLFHGTPIAGATDS